MFSRVFVPIECQTGVPLGYAFVDVDDMEKALQLGGGWMGGRMFLVMMAQYQKESISFPNFDGCQDCGDYLFERRQKRFLARP
ncbi:unnamed protein product [Microthlaspi erraticum]|uniref:RRM domain-containing protein n=1 Tax=Microthlaspi erraticum TaxID=1685480 RepID=A0A6D2JZN6_9BRAS|nr:unnamed protein product [Microthlaspi erraticum]